VHSLHALAVVGDGIFVVGTPENSPANLEEYR